MTPAVVVINPISGTGREAPGGVAEVELARRTLTDQSSVSTVVARLVERDS